MKISKHSHQIIKRIAALTRESPSQILEKALILYQHQIEMERFNQDDEPLKTNKKIWKEILKERELTNF